MAARAADWSQLFTGRHPPSAVAAALAPQLGPNPPAPAALYQNVPAICSWLLGSQGRGGAVHAPQPAAEEAALAGMLAPPSGSLFRAALAMAGDAMLYEVPLSALPRPTQALLDTAERSQLPALLRSRIHAAPGAGDGSHVLAPGKSDQQILIRMTVCEYFLFVFLLAGTAFTAAAPALQPRPAVSGAPATVNSPPAFYLTLLSSYARFFLPPEPGARTDTRTEPSSPTAARRASIAPVLARGASFFAARTATQPAPTGGAEQRPDEPNVFTLVPSADLASALSEFFCDALAELFLGQNALPTPGVAPRDPYVRPPLVVIRGTADIVRMLQGAELGAVEIGVGRMPGRDTLQGAARRRACMAFKWKLYAFLRLAFVYCHEEELFDELSRLYVDYIAPWQQHFDPSYHNLLADRLFFYTSLFRLWLERASKADGAAMAAQLRAAAAVPDGRRPLAEVIISVLSVFCNPLEVLDFLRLLESAFVSAPPSYNHPLGGAENEARILVQAMLGACPAQVRMLEAASYAPVFAPVAPMGREDTRDVAARLAAAVRAGIKALEAVPAAASPVTVPGAVPAPAPPPNPAEKLKGILEMLQTAFGIVAAPDAGNLQAVEMAEMRALERAAPSEEEGALLSPAAKRFNLPHAPMVRANGTLTDRSRYMIRHGLQKASNLDVPIVEEKYQDPWLRMRRERLVGDSENAFLVALTGALGNALQALSVSVLAALAERYPDLKLPVVRRVPARPYVAFEMVPAGECARRVSFRWLRWFASYPNLVGILVVWLAAWFAWRLLLIAGKVLWYAFAAPRAVPTPRAVPQRGPQQGYQRQHQGPGGRGAYKAPMY